MQIADSSNSGAYAEWLADRGVRDQHAGYAHGVSSNAWVGRPHHLPEELLHTFWVVDRAIHFLEHRDDSQPFFLNLSFIDPHPPFTPPRHYYDRYIDRDLPAPPVGDWALDMPGGPVPRKGVNPNAWYIDLDEHDRRCSQAAYYGMINFIDDQIGRLLQVMKTELADTVFLFTADHGEMLGDHHMFRKTWPYEGSARVPFIVSGPTSAPLCSGVVSPAAVGLQDLMPTILDIAGAPIPDAVTGRSLLPIMRGEAPTVREYLHGEHAGQYDYELGQPLPDRRPPQVHLVLADRAGAALRSGRGSCRAAQSGAGRRRGAGSVAVAPGRGAVRPARGVRPGRRAGHRAPARPVHPRLRPHKALSVPLSVRWRRSRVPVATAEPASARCWSGSPPAAS